MRNFYILGSLVILAYWTRAETIDDANVDASNERAKRGFDRLDTSGFRNFMSKRGMFDRFDSYGGFASSGFGKRGFDRFDAFGGFGAPNFGKRAFDRFDSYGFGSPFGKRSFDRLDMSSPGFSSWAKRRFDSFDTHSLGGFRGKRTLDKLDAAGGVFNSGL